MNQSTLDVYSVIRCKVLIQTESTILTASTTKYYRTTYI